MLVGMTTAALLEVPVTPAVGPVRSVVTDGSVTVVDRTPHGAVLRPLGPDAC